MRMSLAIKTEREVKGEPIEDHVVKTETVTKTVTLYPEFIKDVQDSLSKPISEQENLNHLVRCLTEEIRDIVIKEILKGE